MRSHNIFNQNSVCPFRDISKKNPFTITIVYHTLYGKVISNLYRIEFTLFQFSHQLKKLSFILIFVAVLYLDHINIFFIDLFVYLFVLAFDFFNFLLN